MIPLDVMPVHFMQVFYSMTQLTSTNLEIAIALIIILTSLLEMAQQQSQSSISATQRLGPILLISMFDALKQCRIVLHG